jgi:competence protein ComGC
MNGTTPPSFPPSGPAQPPKTSALAIWSLVLGILSVLGCCILIAIPAVICGHTALGRIRKSSGTLQGEGLAIAGLITGYVGMVIWILLAIIAIPNFVKARDTAQTNACINNLRQIYAAKQQWALENSKPADAVPTENDLTPYLENHQMPHCPAGGVYTIGAVTNNPTCSIPSHKLSD